MLKDKIATLEKQPTDFLNADVLLYSYVNTLSLDKIKESVRILYYISEKQFLTARL